MFNFSWYTFTQTCNQIYLFQTCEPNSYQHSRKAFWTISSFHFIINLKLQYWSNTVSSDLEKGKAGNFKNISTKTRDLNFVKLSNNSKNSNS